MTSPRRKIAAAAFALVAWSARVAADDEVPTAPIVEAQPAPMPTPQLWLRSGDGVLRGPNGRDYLIPRDSRVLNPDEWRRLDLELKQLQDERTRREAENKSLRATAAEWQPGWIVLTSALVAGLAGGIYLGVKL